MTPEELERRLQALRERYATTLPERVDALRKAVDELVSGQGSIEDAVDTAKRAHNLAGTGASFGFARLGDEARELESALADWPKGSQSTSAEYRDRLKARLDALVAEANRALGWGPGR